MAETETPTTSATTTPTATGDDLQLEQQVEITDKGPCLKHIKVTVPREIINRLLDQKLGELGRTVPVPGFRPGKAPAQLVRRYLEPQALEEIRPTLLLASLQQILEQHNLNPITTPNFDPLAVCHSQRRTTGLRIRPRSLAGLPVAHLQGHETQAACFPDHRRNPAQ
jgi:trigger factor